MKTGSGVLTPEEKRQQELKISRFFNKYYEELTTYTTKAINVRKLQDETETAEIINKLYPFINRLAFVDEGWLDEQSVLAQCKFKIKNSLLKDVVSDKRKHEERYTSLDAAGEQSEETGFLPEAYHIQATQFDSLASADFRRALRDVLDTPYKRSLYLVLMRERTAVSIAQKYDKHESTVGRDAKRLAQELREYLLNEGAV